MCTFNINEIKQLKINLMWVNTLRVTSQGWWLSWWTKVSKIWNYYLLMLNFLWQNNQQKIRGIRLWSKYIVCIDFMKKVLIIAILRTERKIPLLMNKLASWLALFEILEWGCLRVMSYHRIGVRSKDIKIDGSSQFYKMLFVSKISTFGTFPLEHLVYK